MEADSEPAAEEATLEASVNVHTACRVCGHHNREGNKFCGACGIALVNEPPSSVTTHHPLRYYRPLRTTKSLSSKLRHQRRKQRMKFIRLRASSAGTHHYHHHYHHHYFQGGRADEAAAAPRPNAPESAREADRMRVAAAAKGEPMSRGEAAVRRLTQEWVLACNTRQLDELIELYAPDALVLRSNLPTIRGVMAVREFFHASLEAGLGEVAVDPMRVEVIGDMAHEVGRYSALVPGTAGKRREERGKYLWVFAKQASGDWKLGLRVLVERSNALGCGV